MTAQNDFHVGDPKMLIARGAKAVEALLIQDLDDLVQSASKAPLLLRRPVRVVVPSHSLKDHLSALLVRRHARSIAGLAIHTLHGLALEILGRGGEIPLTGAPLFEILVRRFARDEVELQEGLDHLVDGYGAATRAVLDFIDAGFEPVHAEALEERLAEYTSVKASEIETRRARALVRVTARTLETMNEWGIGLPSQLLQRAKEWIQRDPAKVLPARAVLIHGFADATGEATDFIEALMRQCGAWIYMDYPSDPAAPDQPDLGIAFTRRFAGRLEALSQVHEHASPSPHPRFSMFKAPGAHAEIRAVAVRILSLLGRGVPPERIAVVGRDLRPYRVPLRLHFGRLGIPFSSYSTQGPPGPKSRRVHALLEVLRRRMDTPADRWLDAQERPLSSISDINLPKETQQSREALRFDLRLALRAAGAARLRDVAELAVDGLLDAEGSYPLPVRRGFRESEDEEGNGRPPRAVRRRIPGGVLARAVQAAKTLKARWEGWSVRTTLRSHLRSLVDFLQEELGWDMDEPVTLEIRQALESLSTENPGDFPLDYDEFVLLLSHGLSQLGVTPLGGLGGGVQVLNVMEARGLTFEHLFLIGLNRDVFPRTIREDPLLPDPVRMILEDVLPDIPIKGRGFDEERYLFAQLMSASPEITLSWQVVDDEGKARAVSPLVDRLRLSLGMRESELVPPLYGFTEERVALGDDDARVLRPAYEHAVLAGLYGSRSQFEQILPIAIAEAMNDREDDAEDGQAETLARVRVRVLDELDPDQRTAEGRMRMLSLGPYFGFLGSVREKADPRLGELYITTVESLAACPWQTLLRRLLHIEPTPDPLEALPTVDALLRGAVVHAVLERMVAENLANRSDRLDEMLAREPLAMNWPESAEVTRLSREEAERIMRETGSGLQGLSQVLEAQVRPYLEVARKLDWPDGHAVVHALGAELLGDLTVVDDAGAARTIFFKADRVDRIAGGVRLTDYKTGRSISHGVKEATRRAHFLRDVRKGEWLQAVAYVLGGGGDHVEGRYLFLKPDIPESARTFSVTYEDQELIDAFMAAVRPVLKAWDLGIFFPRLVEPDGRKEPRLCQHCQVAEACLRGDSGARARLVRWAEQAQETDREQRPHEAALWRIWALWDTKSEPLSQHVQNET